MSLWPAILDANEWKLFVSEDGRFSIMAPKPPVKSPTLGPTSVIDFDLGEDEVGVVTYTSSEIFSPLWPPNLEDIAGEVVYVCGNEGREVVITSEDGTIGIARSFYVGKRFYTVDGIASSPEIARRFVESFKLLKPEKAK